MALEKFGRDIEVISKLSDLPNSADGLSAAQFKAKFDESARLLKDYINNILIPQIETAISGAAQGLAPDETFDGGKLTDNSVSDAKIIELDGKKIKFKTLPASALVGDLGREQFVGGRIPLQTEDFGAGIIPPNSLGNGAVTSSAIGKESVTGEKIAPDTIEDKHLGASAKSRGIAVVLTAKGWSNGTQEVSATGVTATNNLIIAAAPSSRGEYSDAEIYCSSQSDNKLVFKCANAPTVDVTANVIILP